MRKAVMFCSLCVPALLAAQGTTVEGFAFWSPASLADMGKAMQATAEADPHHMAAKPLASFSNEYFLLGRRTADGQPEWHENEVDVFVAQSGSATLLVGGTLTGADTVAPHEKRGGTIQGGTRQKLSPGDIVRIPPRTPHQVLLDGSKEFTYFVMKVKGY